MGFVQLKGLLDDKLAQEFADQNAGKIAEAGIYGAAADKLQKTLTAAIISEEEAREEESGLDTIEYEQDCGHVCQLRKWQRRK